MAWSLFYSYSHEDEQLREQLEKHLSLLRRNGVIREWHDRKIVVGKDWAGEISENLEKADLILLLVSSSFINSAYCYETEMKRAMERHHASESVVIPIILRSCDWQDAPFGKLQSLPKNGKAINSWGDVDEAFTDVAQGIRKLAASINTPVDRYENADNFEFTSTTSSKDAGIATMEATIETELIIDADFDSYSPDAQAALLRAVSALLNIGPLKIEKKRRHSVSITLRLTPQQAERLKWAVMQGQFDEHYVKEVFLHTESQEQPSLQAYTCEFSDCQKGEATPVKLIPESSDLSETQDSDRRPEISHSHRSLQPGQWITHYQLVEIVGEGAFGVVWKALDKQLDRSVAIKIPKHNYTTEREQSWFFREARAAAKLKHASIVAVYDVGQDENVRFIVSEFIEGQPLSDFVKNKPLPPRAAAELCKQIADAVAHAHENGVTHRDLKPSNILMDVEGKPHLLDFGLAKLEVIDQTLTADDLVLGTPGYMSPEQARGASRDADTRSDVYSLGILLFQLLTGELPFRGTFHAVIRQHIETPASSPRTLDGRIPQDLESIVVRCLEKSPQHRFSNAGELSLEIARFLSGLPLSFRPQGPLTRFLRWFYNNREVSVQTTGITFIIVGALLCIWSSLGVCVVSFRVLEVQDINMTLREILVSILALELPVVVLGFALLKGVRGAIPTSVAITLIGFLVAIAGSFNWIYTGQQFGADESRWPLFHLLAVLSAGGCFLSTSTLLVDRWHRRNM